MGEGSNETHSHHGHCDRHGRPRSLWRNLCHPERAAGIADAKRSDDTHRNARASADHFLNSHALTVGKPVAWHKRLTQPDRGALRLRALRNRMGLRDHVRGPWYRSGWEADRYVDRRIRTDGTGCA